MIKRLKLQNNTYWWADFHAAHDKDFIWQKRGFKNVIEHDQTLVEKWNSKVGKNDTIIYLGDFSVGANNTLEYTIEILENLNGKIIYVFGNHETQIEKIYHRTVREKYGTTMNGFEVYPITWNDKVTFVGQSVLLSIDKQIIYCRHMAPLIFDHMQHNAVCCVGHSHAQCETINPEYKGQKILDCGVDNFPNGPISFNELMEIMNSKKFEAVDHHTKPF